MDTFNESRFSDEPGFSIVDDPDEKISEESAMHVCNAKLEKGIFTDRCQVEVQAESELCYYHQKKAEGLIA
jgi:hypothetical protein